MDCVTFYLLYLIYFILPLYGKIAHQNRENLMSAKSILNVGYELGRIFVGIKSRFMLRMFINVLPKLLKSFLSLDSNLCQQPLSSLSNPLHQSGVQFAIDSFALTTVSLIQRWCIKKL